MLISETFVQNKMSSFFELFFSSPTRILTTCGLALFTWHYWTMLRKRIGMPPGPISLPFIGTTYTFPRDMTQWPFHMAKLAQKYGGIVTQQLTNGMCVVVMTDPKLYREVFGRNTDAAGRPFRQTRKLTQRIYNPHFPQAGFIFGDYDEQLKLQRNTSMVVLRSLGYGKKSIENKIIEEAEHLVDAFKQLKGKPFYPKHLLDNAVANIICSLLFDKRYDYGDQEFQELQRDIDKLFEFITLTIPVDYIWFLKYLPSKKKQLKEFQTVADRVNEIITAKINERRESMKKGDENTDFITAYLTEVEKAGGKLEDRSHQLVKDFFAAGSETTSTTLGWSLYFMAKYPQVQQRIRKDLTDILGEGRKPTLKDKDNFPYIEATLTEILRVAPTAPGSLPHSAITDTEIAGYKIPKGTTVQGAFTIATFDPVAFPEPHVLKPERHLDSEGQYVRNEMLTPFGVGRRSCLGEQLAKQELFLFFTHLIQSFEFKVPEGETLPPQKGNWFITYRPPVYNITAVPLH